MKLVDVPVLGYTSEDKPNPRGELCVRGLNIFDHYYKGMSLLIMIVTHYGPNYCGLSFADPENTNNSVDNEGWFHTGDVAEFDSCGRVKIIDRVKNIMKLAQGEYVALEKIENIFSSNPIVAQIYVHGDSLQSYLLAVVVPDPLKLADVASKILGKGVSSQDDQALLDAIKDDRINAYVLSELTKDGKKYGLKGLVSRPSSLQVHLTKCLAI